MKRLHLIIVNLLIFWVVVDAMPGIDSPKGPIGLLIAGFGYGAIMAYIANVLKFFKFPVNFWGKFLIGTLFTLLWLVILNFVIKGVITFGSGYIGGSDFIIFTIPKLIQLPNEIVVILVGAIILVSCSIIVENLSKKKD